MKIIFESFKEIYNNVEDLFHTTTSELDVKFQCTQEAKKECIEYFKEKIEMYSSKTEGKLVMGSHNDTPLFRELLHYKGIEIEVIQ